MQIRRNIYKILQNGGADVTAYGNGRSRSLTHWN